jgi:hypothetical protein
VIFINDIVLKIEKIFEFHVIFFLTACQVSGNF